MDKWNALQRIRRLAGVGLTTAWTTIVVFLIVFVPPIRYLAFAFIVLTLAIGTLNYLAKIGPTKAWRRTYDGLCRECGYDLRESVDRCPECGSAVEEWRYMSLGSRSTRSVRKKLADRRASVRSKPSRDD